MSVLIKGMEMPTSCDECELCTCYVREDGTEENYRCVITFYPIHEFNERHEYCPLIEVPPHGRLIDADALMKDGWVLHKQVIRMGGYAIHEMPLNCPSLPTIIEAEESGDELSTN